MTAPGSTLQDSVTRLCDEHMVSTEAGYAKVPALLDQLENLERSSSGGRSGGMSLPINTESIDLMRCIREEALEYGIELYGTYRGTLKALIRSFAVESITGEWQTFLEHVVLDWCDQIEALLKPRKPRRKLTAACPSCGEMIYGEERSYALSAWCWDKDENLMHPSLWDVSCAVCGAQWKGEEIAWLKAAFEAGPGERIEA